jgi:Rrf2 family nitric oxide-sensitive transcriptional repressor
MRLTAFTDYSLRVLLFLATAPEGRATIAEIARAYGVSQNHLVKVAHLLGREGFLVTTRGRSGGLRLAKAPSAVNVGNVVRVTEGPSVLAECFDPDGGQCPIARVCSLIPMFQQADNAFYGVLDRYTLADLVATPRRMAAILHRTPLPQTGERQ